MFSLLSHTFIHFCGVTLCRTFSQISDNFLSQIFVFEEEEKSKVHQQLCSSMQSEWNKDSLCY